MKASRISSVVACLAPAFAAPSETGNTTATSQTPTSTAASGCTVTTYADVPRATASCTAITLKDITVPPNVALDLSKLLTGTTVTFAGTTTFEFYEWKGVLILVGGTNVHITAEPGAIIDGNGQAWWDGLGSNGGVLKPNDLMSVKALGNSLIDNLYIQNWPSHCFTISGSDGLIIENLILNNTAGNAPNARSGGLAAAHNSDGFDISSTQNMILRDSIVLNQDDCVAITSGNNITTSGMYCDGSHGLSIGSIGGKSNNNVTNILFENSQVLNSQNGVRIKANYNTTGFVSDITYRNIFISNATIYGLDIQEDYLNGGPTGTPTNGVIIQNIAFQNVTGTANAKATNYYILCGDGSCSNFIFEEVSITGGTDDSCNFHGISSPC